MKHILSILLLILPLMVSAKKSAFIVGKIPENQRSEVQNKHISDISASYGDIFEDRDLFFRTNLSDNLNFCLEVPLNFDKQVVKFNIAGMIEYNVFVSAGDTTFMEIDLNNANYIQSAVYDYEFVKFSGKNADINTALASKMFKEFLDKLNIIIIPKNIKIKKYPVTAETFNNIVTEEVTRIKSIFQQFDTTRYTSETKDFIKTELNIFAVRRLMMYFKAIRNNYRYGISHKIKFKNNYRLEMDSVNLSFIKEFDFNNANSKSTSYFYETAIWFKYEFDNPLPGEKNVRPEDVFAGNDVILQLINKKDDTPLKPSNAKAKYFTIQSTTEKDIWHEIFNSRRGHVVLVDFWYPGCSGCIYAQNEMRKIEPELTSKGVDFVYITYEQKASLRDYYKASSMFNGDSYLLNDDQFKAFFKKHKFTWWPHYMIIDKNGNISYFGEFNNLEFFKPKVEEALKK